MNRLIQSSDDCGRGGRASIIHTDTEYEIDIEMKQKQIELILKSRGSEK